MKGKHVAEKVFRPGHIVHHGPLGINTAYDEEGKRQTELSQVTPDIFMPDKAGQKQKVVEVGNGKGKAELNACKQQGVIPIVAPALLIETYLVQVKRQVNAPENNVQNGKPVFLNNRLHAPEVTAKVSFRFKAR